MTDTIEQMTILGAKAPIETRSVAISDVRYPERIIELVAAPYDQWDPVEYHGRVIEESFAPGAFGNVQNRASRFLVNLEHDKSRVVGRVHALYPERPEGLFTELFIRRGPEGDQVLDDANDQMVGASVGFGALPTGQQWEGRNRRRILKAFLDHVGLTVEPAYVGTMPIAVRSKPIIVQPPLVANATTSTPNLDKILAQRMAKQYNCD